MASTIAIKVYNKEDKLKVLVQENESFRVVNIYKYDEENEEIHSFTYLKPPKSMTRFVENGEGYVETELKLSSSQQAQQDRTSYYDFLRSVNGIIIERLWVSNLQMEHWEVVGDMEEQKIIKNFNSGNVYEERKKNIKGELYSTEFKNGELTNFRFTIPENKINEYLEKISYGE
jgi:hypothetical protein